MASCPGWVLFVSYVGVIYVYVFACVLIVGEEELLCWAASVSDDFVKVEGDYGKSSSWEETAQGLDPENLLL